MKTLYVTLLSFGLIFTPLSKADPARFFANPELQGKAPRAFALTRENLGWLKQAHHIRQDHAEKLFQALKNNQALFKELKRWPELSFERRVEILPEVFAIECEVLGMTPPELVINNTLYPKRPVNFVYDVKSPGSGLVYLNPDRLKDMELYAPLAFLLHETRHAYQFQMAFSEKGELANGYKQAFIAQSELSELSGFSFSDFLTLLNEYEAFQFGNHVLGLLTDWKMDMPTMGTYASQFSGVNALKLDLVEMANMSLNASLLQAYNRAAQAQYQLRQEKN